jgi:hypothetical protein
MRIVVMLILTGCTLQGSPGDHQIAQWYAQRNTTGACNSVSAMAGFAGKECP